jgi:hypothetical protein
MTEAYTENGAAMLLGAGNECSTSVKKSVAGRCSSGGKGFGKKMWRALGKTY